MSDRLAALYLRVSTLDQHPETQLHDLRQMAAQRGLEVAGIYEDRITGTRASRPGLRSADERRPPGQVPGAGRLELRPASPLGPHFLETLDELNRFAGWSSSASGSSSTRAGRWAGQSR